MARHEAWIDDRICGSRILNCISAFTSRGAKISVVSFVANDDYIEAGRLRSQTVRGAGYESSAS